MTASSFQSRGFSVIRDQTAAGDIPPGAVLAIGNFDGVHRGHRTVIAAALGMAENLKRPALAVTFEPHPRDFLRPDVPQFRLTDERGKLRLLAATGLDGAVVMTFDAARAATTAQDFINRDLIARFAPAGLAVGFDFHFGKDRAGTPDFLLAAAGARSIPVHVQPKFSWQGRPVSSSVIRAALARGDIAAANDLLGYPWFVTSDVVHGDKRGRDLGFPTANLRLDPSCGLRHGIYAARIGRGAERFAGVASFGRRPTFDNGAPLLEVFLFDFHGDLYGATLDVAFVAFLRDEERFDNIEALIRQMKADGDAARAALRRAGDAFPPLGALAP